MIFDVAFNAGMTTSSMGINVTHSTTIYCLWRFSQTVVTSSVCTSEMFLHDGLLRQRRCSEMENTHVGTGMMGFLKQ
jgi:hypothetical protein